MVENSSCIFHLRWKISPYIFAFGENLPSFSPLGKNLGGQATIYIKESLDKFQFLCYYLSPFLRYYPFKYVILLYPHFYPLPINADAPEVVFQHNSTNLSSFSFLYMVVHLWATSGNKSHQHKKNRTQPFPYLPLLIQNRTSFSPLNAKSNRGSHQLHPNKQPLPNRRIIS